MEVHISPIGSVIIEHVEQTKILQIWIGKNEVRLG